MIDIIYFCYLFIFLLCSNNSRCGYKTKLKMFLDSLNCYHIKGVGLFVYFPEIDRVIFYEEKKAEKILNYESISFIEQEGDQPPWIQFENCTPVPIETLGKKLSVFASIRRSIKSAAKGGPVNIVFTSEYNSSNFKKFFQEERVNKIDQIIKQNQIDYLIVVKYSTSKRHTANLEYRILRIDWANKIIKYYGEEEGGIFKQINDYYLPPHNPGHEFTIKTLKDFMIKFTSHMSEGDAVDAYAAYVKQLLLNGYGISLLSETIQKPLYEQVISSLISSLNPIITRSQIEKILKLLETSLFKTEWFNFKDNKDMETFLNGISIIPASSTLTDINPGITGGYQLIVNDMTKNDGLKDKAFNVKIPYQESEIDFTFNKQTILSGQNTNNRSVHKISKCGAENCYFPVSDNSGKNYGLRLSAFIYTKGDFGLYNLIIDNIINSILHSYLEYISRVGGITTGMKISKVLKFGLIKVKFTYKDGREMKNGEGYIPYTLTEHVPDYIQINKHIHNLCDNNPENPLDPFFIDKLIKDILCKVYNFFALVKPYFNFSHNDFKTNNILINPVNNELYLIDFGTAQINLHNGSGVFNISNRIIFYGENYEEYKWYIKFMSNLYSSDNDIETLLYWLSNIYLPEDYNESKPKRIQYIQIVRTIFESLIKTITQDKPSASRDVKTTLGRIIYDNGININGSLFAYRMFQIYLIISSKIKTIKLTKNSPAYCKSDCAITPKSDSDFAKYLFTFNEDEYQDYQKQITELFAQGPALPAALASSSVAGGSRKLHRKSKLKSIYKPKTKHNSRKYNSRKHNTSHHRKSHRKTRYAK